MRHFGILLTHTPSPPRIPCLILLLRPNQSAFSAAWDDHQTAQKVIAGFRPKPLDACPAEVYDTATKCWAAKPADRPDFFWLRGEFEDKAAAPMALAARWRGGGARMVPY